MVLSGDKPKALLAACDTFRAAAADQLEIWAGRAGVEIVKQKPGADPAAVAYDGMARAKSRPWLGVNRNSHCPSAGACRDVPPGRPYVKASLFTTYGIFAGLPP